MSDFVNQQCLILRSHWREDLVIFCLWVSHRIHFDFSRMAVTVIMPWCVCAHEIYSSLVCVCVCVRACMVSLHSYSECHNLHCCRLLPGSYGIHTDIHSWEGRNRHKCSVLIASIIILSCVSRAQPDGWLSLKKLLPPSITDASTLKHVFMLKVLFN